MNTYELNSISIMMTENYREIDVLKDYWTIRGDVREISYKLNSILSIMKYLVIADYSKTKTSRKADEKEKHREKLLQLKTQFNNLDKKRINFEYNIEDDKAFLDLCISLADELIDWFKLGEKMQDEIIESYRFVIENQGSVQRILTQNCKNIISPSMNLFGFYNENKFDRSKDLDRIDNIEIVLRSCKILKNDKFKSEWFNRGVNNNISNLLKIKNLNENIKKVEKEYAIVSENLMYLLEQLDKEKIMTQSKKLNFSMLLLALIGGIGVLSNTINISDNISSSLIVLVLLVAFAKWLVL